MRQISAADEVKVEQLDVLRCCLWVYAFKEFVYFFTGFLAELFNVILHLNPLEQYLVLVERLKGRFSKS